MVVEFIYEDGSRYWAESGVPRRLLLGVIERYRSNLTLVPDRTSMGAMAAQSPPSNDLTTLTLDAVRALLRQIAAGGVPGSGNAAPIGTHASFAAQALRDLMQCGPLSTIVSNAIREEEPVKPIADWDEIPQ